MASKRRWLKRLLIVLGILILLLAIAGIVVFIKGPDWLKSTVASDGFRQMLSREVSKALKVEGEFAPLTLEGWTAKTASYESTGEPGQAIGALNAYGIEGTFVPAGVLKSQWLLSLIKVERGEFVLREPNDALKKPEKKGPKPWYAFLMPAEFHVDWIDCPEADVKFPLGGVTGGLKSVQLGATMIGRNFQYYVKNGELSFPGYAPLQVDALGIYVTRNVVEVQYGYLRAPKGDGGKLSLSGRMGQRSDKSIDAKVTVEEFGLEPFLPKEVRPYLSGKITGDFSYRVDKTGQNANGEGKLSWTGAGLGDWGPLEDAARVPGRSDLTKLKDQKVELNYTLEDNLFKIPELGFEAAGKVRFSTSVEYDLKNATGKLNAKLQDMPVSVWLPKELQTLTNAMIQGNVEWQGSVEDWESSTASGNLDFGGATVENPVTTIASLGKYAPRFPSKVDLTEAKLAFGYDKRTLEAKNLILHARDFFEVEGSGSWDEADRLDVDVKFRFPSVDSWLPPVLGKQLGGTLRGQVKWSAPRVDLVEGRGNGTLALDGGTLHDFEFQQVVARFLKDDSWLTLEFDRMELDWRRSGDAIEVSRLDFFAPERAGLRGSVRVAESGAVSGTVKVGLVASALEWLPDATTTIFDESSDGLHWATVQLSGTTDHLKEDLVQRVIDQVKKHPLALAGLVAKGISWWLGDELGTAPKIDGEIEGDPQQEKREKPQERPRRHGPHKF